MTITAKFASVCGTCHTRIAIGERINWERGKSSHHADAALCAKAKLAQDSSDALARATGSVRVTTTDGPVVAVSRPSVSLSGLVGFLRAAKEGRNGGKPLKFPKVAFAAPGNGEIVISLSPDSGRNPGALYVKLNGEYAGKVTADGVAFGLDALLPTLRAIEADPAGAGAAYGALRGHCSFCQTKLDDEGSLAVGYGPTCAKNYGLPHKAKGRAKSVPVVNVTPAPVAVETDVLVPSTSGITWRIKGGTRSAVVDRRIDAAVEDRSGDFDGTLDYNEGAAKAARLTRTVLCSDCGDYHTVGTNCADYDAL